jgi:glycogen operon protein
MRRRHPVFRRRRFLQGDSVTADGLKEILWLSPDGREMTEAEWAVPFARCLGLYLAGAAIERRDRRGRLVTDNNFVLLCNAHHEPIPFQLPAPLAEKVWWTELDTSARTPFAQQRLEPATPYPLQGRSLALLRETAYR